MSFGLAMTATLEDEGLALGCENVTYGMTLKDTDKKHYLGSWWFDTESDRQACISYADALACTFTELQQFMGGSVPKRAR